MDAATVSFGVLAGLAGLLGMGPYLRDLLRRRTSPHRGTWVIWSTLSVVVFWSQRADGATWSLVMAGLHAVLNTATVLLVLRRGVGGVGSRDIALLCVAAGGVAAWLVADDPTTATAAVVAADLVGVLLMVPKTWRDPRSETLCTYGWASGGGAFAAGAVGVADPALLLYPTYYCLANGALAMLIVWRRRGGHARREPYSSAASLPSILSRIASGIAANARSGLSKSQCG